MNKEKAKFYIVLSLEILAIVLASVGVFPREAILIITGLLIFYFIFSKIEDSLILFIISIPLFVALPIEGYDSMANWRILLTVLFLVWLSKKISFKNKLSKIKTIVKGVLWLKKLRKFKLFKWTCLFLLIGALSLFVAVDIFAGVKKILFLINIFLLFVVVKDLAKNKKIKQKIIKAGAVSGGISLIFGYSQLASVFFSPLHSFWQWWASNVIPVFYGNNLARLLAKSNTWFSYYQDSPPTLRMFSIFPDSHSFALFTIIGLIFLSYLLIYKNKKIFWIPIVLSFLSLVFCGSRGVWVSSVIPLGIIVVLFIYAFFKNKKHSLLIHNKLFLVRVFIGFLLIFLISFPTSSLILSASQNTNNGGLAFKRAKSIADLEEISVKSRMGIWKKSFTSILKNPILGVGIGNFPVVLNEDISTAKKGASAHNLYLDVTSEMGFLGLIILLLIFWQIFKKSIKANNIFGYVLAFFFAWIAIYALFDVVLLNDKVLLFFMVALGALYGKK